MIRGQISIDLLITLIVVIMIIGAFTLILTDFQNEQEEFFLKAQLKENSSKLATFITSTNAINDSNFTAQTLIHNISYKNVSIRPLVSIDTNFISLTINANGENIIAKAFFSKIDSI